MGRRSVCDATASMARWESEIGESLESGLMDTIENSNEPLPETKGVERRE